MQHTASLVQIAASRRSPALVAGVGAAFLASAIFGDDERCSTRDGPRSRSSMVQKINARWLTVRCWSATTGGGGTIQD